MRKYIRNFAVLMGVIGGIFALAGSPADAAAWDCSFKHCWFDGTSGSGAARPVNDPNNVLSLNVRSARNRNTVDLAMCGYKGTYMGGGTSTKTNRGVTHSFTLRPVKSNNWKPRGAAC